MAGNFIPMVYAVLKDKGVDTSKMTTEQAVEKYNELIGKTGRYNTKTGDKAEEREKLEKRYNSNYSMKEQGFSSEDSFVKTDSKTFHNNIIKAKESNPPEVRWRVDIHKEADYRKDKLFTTKNGSCVAVEPNGNIISVCRRNGDNVRGRELLRHALEHGGDRLDAFGENLYKFYTRQGFEPVSWTPFNEAYAPEGWDKNRDEPEPIIFYRYTGKVINETYDEFKNRVKPSNDYGAAMQLRDKEMTK